MKDVKAKGGGMKLVKPDIGHLVKTACREVYGRPSTIGLIVNDQGALVQVMLPAGTFSWVLRSGVEVVA